MGLQGLWVHLQQGELALLLSSDDVMSPGYYYFVAKQHQMCCAFIRVSHLPSFIFYFSFPIALLSRNAQAECAGMYFEEQGPGFRCPQCSGPRRRYAKKVGDRVGTTLDGGDAPILLFSFGGVIATIAFGIWAINNL